MQQHSLELVRASVRPKTWLDDIGDAVSNWGESVGNLFEGTFTGDWEKARKGLSGTTFGQSEKVIGVAEGIVEGDWEKIGENVGEFVGLDEEARKQLAAGNIGAGFSRGLSNKFNSLYGGSSNAQTAAFMFDQAVGINGADINMSMLAPSGANGISQFMGKTLELVANQTVGVGSCDACHKSNNGVLGFLEWGTKKGSGKAVGAKLAKPKCKKLTQKFIPKCMQLMKGKAKGMCPVLSLGFNVACEKVIGKIVGEVTKAAFNQKVADESCADSCKLNKISDRSVELKKCVGVAATQHGHKMKNSFLPIVSPMGPAGCSIKQSGRNWFAHFNPQKSDGSSTRGYTRVNSLLRMCEGNCSSNDECFGDLVCHPSHKNVPGCSGTGTPGHKYCSRGLGTAGKWVLGAKGENCEQTCANKSLACNKRGLSLIGKHSADLEGINYNTDETIANDFKQTGAECKSYIKTAGSKYGATIHSDGVCTVAPSESACNAADAGFAICEKACKDDAACKSFSYYDGFPNPKKCVAIMGGTWTAACQRAFGGRKQCILSRDALVYTDGPGEKNWTSYYMDRSGTGEGLKWSSGYLRDDRRIRKFDIVNADAPAKKQHMCFCQSKDAVSQMNKILDLTSQARKTMVEMHPEHKKEKSRRMLVTILKTSANVRFHIKCATLKQLSTAEKRRCQAAVTNADLSNVSGNSNAMKAKMETTLQGAIQSWVNLHKRRETKKLRLLGANVKKTTFYVQCSVLPHYKKQCKKAINHVARSEYRHVPGLNWSRADYITPINNSLQAAYNTWKAKSDAEIARRRKQRKIMTANLTKTSYLVQCSALAHYKNNCTNAINHASRSEYKHVPGLNWSRSNYLTKINNNLKSKYNHWKSRSARKTRQQLLNFQRNTYKVMCGMNYSLKTWRRNQCKSGMNRLSARWRMNSRVRWYQNRNYFCYMNRHIAWFLRRFGQGRLIHDCNI